MFNNPFSDSEAPATTILITSFNEYSKEGNYWILFFSIFEFFFFNFIFSLIKFDSSFWSVPFQLVFCISFFSSLFNLAIDFLPNTKLLSLLSSRNDYRKILTSCSSKSSMKYQNSLNKRSNISPEKRFSSGFQLQHFEVSTFHDQ